MEGLLILVGIYVLDIVIKKMAAGKKQQQTRQRDVSPQESNKDEAQPQPKRNLQDLIRQFEEAQREASQGTYVPPTPPVEQDPPDESYNKEDFPVVTPANPNEFTFSEIAESVVQWEFVSVELLQDAFGFSEKVAGQVLAELQSKRIAGRDMGDGYCDLLVHDSAELENLFKQLQREEKEKRDAEAQEAALKARREAELKHQKELAELEEKARQLREQTTTPCMASASHQSHSQTFDKGEIRRGFIWAKVLDEPRFKRHWTPNIR